MAEVFEIKHDKKNYRVHSAENKALIKKSLEDCGVGRSILIDNENEIIAGNGVYEQAKNLGLPVKVVESDGKELLVIKRTDLKTDDAKRKELAVMDNTTSDSSEFDIEALETDFGVKELDGFGITGLGEDIGAPDLSNEIENDEEDEEEEKEGENYNQFHDSDAEKEIDYEDEYSDDAQRVIICYKKEDREKLESIFGKPITKISYNIKELVNND